MKELTIEITRKCLNNCIYCSSCSTQNTTQSLPKEKIVKLIKDSKKLGFTHINFSGGEPFLSDNLLLYIKTASDLGMITTIYSSGVLIKDGKKTSISKDILSQIKGVSKIVFNFQGASDDKYREITGNQHGIYYILKSIYNAYSLNIDMEFNYVPMTINIKDFNEIVEIAGLVNVHKINILKLVVQGRASDDLKLNQHIQKEFLEYILKKYNNNSKILIRIGDSFSECNKKKCNAGINKIVIRYDGAILPCERYKFRALKDVNVFTYTLRDACNYYKSIRIKDKL